MGQEAAISKKPPQPPNFGGRSIPGFTSAHGANSKSPKVGGLGGFANFLIPLRGKTAGEMLSREAELR
jgi:hypothetical protein